MRKLFLGFGFFVALLSLFNGYIFSQENSTVVQNTKKVGIETNDIKQGTAISCFDYYTFGSIDVNLTPNYNSYQPGDPVIITGIIKNKNRYPVIGLDIKARLVKNIPAPEPMRAEIMVLDEFDVADNITLDANGEFQVSYTHLLPLNAPAGQYQMYFYAVEQDRFNLSGLSFTNDIVASRMSFDVEGKQPDHIYLDQTKIVVGDQPHNVMAFMTQHTTDTKIPISLPLVNPSKADKQMTVTYSLYSWDAANPANKIVTKTEQVLVPAKSEKLLTYTLEKGELPVYYLSVSAEPTSQTADQSVVKEKTISNIRFVIQGISKPRLNFVGVDSFPLKKGTESTLITCFHNTSAGVDTQKTTIETVVLDSKNNELSRTEYQGKIVPGIEGIKNTFTPRKDIGEFTVIAKMSDSEGREIDTVIKKYSCRDINPNMCPPPETMKQQQVLWGVVVAIVCIGVIIVMRRRKNNPKI